MGYQFIDTLDKFDLKNGTLDGTASKEQKQEGQFQAVSGNDALNLFSINYSFLQTEFKKDFEGRNQPSSYDKKLNWPWLSSNTKYKCCIVNT